MTNDLTYNSIVFAKAYDTATESLRRSVARGVNLPDDLKIKQQTYVDSKTKLSGTRTVIRIERAQVDANLNQITPSIYVVAEIPSTTAQGDIDSLVASFRAMVADTTADTLELAIAGQK
jgi:hypothetical protein